MGEPSVPSKKPQTIKIQAVMTPNPLTIQKDATLQDALGIMRQKTLRHLPVVNSEQKVIGLITDRDIKLAASFDSAGEMKVGDVMIEKPYCVESVTSLRNVALYMAENRYGCALILQEGRVIGIFTAEDGLRTLGEMLHAIDQESAA